MVILRTINVNLANNHFQGFCKILQHLILRNLQLSPNIIICSLSRRMSTFVQKMNTVTGSYEWVQEDDTYDYHQEVARSAYADMLHDHDRNMKYYYGLQLAITELKQRGEIVKVLDIGTGTGLLSMMAAKLGADIIYACEAFSPMADCAKKVIHRNGFTNRIKLIPKRSTQLEVGEGKDMDTKANILVTEVFDTELIGEGAISTYNHAHEYLLQENAFVIPTKANYYAQIVNCSLVTSFNSLSPLKFSNDKEIRFPGDINRCSGIPSVHDVQLSEVKTSEFTKLSPPIKIFTFDWANHSETLKKYDKSSTRFLSIDEGECTGIFTWWDLEMSSLADKNDSKNIITMKPEWAGIDSCWRDHWMQSMYYNHKPIQMFPNRSYTLTSFHDEYSFWYRVSETEKEDGDSKCFSKETNLEAEMEAPVCTCGIHIGLSRSRIGMFNDPERRTKYLHTLRTLVTAETVAVVLSEGSILPFVIAGLGAKQVFVRESNIFSKRAMEKLSNVFKNTIAIVDELDETTFKGSKVNLVVAEPYFHDAVLPWHNLYYWYSLHKLKPFLSPDARILPQKGFLRCIVTKFRDLWKIRSDVGYVCFCEFDLQDFDKLIRDSSEVSDSIIDSQPLWEYPSTVKSEVITLMEFNFNDPIKDKDTFGTIEYGKDSNGIAIWMDWEFDAKIESVEKCCISTGLVSFPNGFPTFSRHENNEFEPEQTITWDRYSKQGVYQFSKNQKKQSSLNFKVSFKESNGHIYFNFT